MKDTKESQTQIEAYKSSREEVIREYNTSEEGLSHTEAEKRLETHGLNKIQREGGISPIQMFLSEFNDPLVLLLIGAMVISAVIALNEGEPLYDSTMIGIIVVANAIIGFIQEYRAEQSLQALKEMLEPTATVIREGHKQEVPAEKVVPGDIITLLPGDRVPADARLINASNLETQEAPLTGESTPVTKESKPLSDDIPIGGRENMVFMGTTVTKGAGEAVVTETGMTTEFGQIAHEVQRVEKEETPLMRRIGRFGKKLTIGIILITVAAVVVEYLQTLDLIKSFMVSVGLAISAVPEGLPAVVTITLAIGMGKLARKNAIVRKLSSVEALGSTTVINSDKTGTMTKNEMTVKEAYVDGATIRVSGSGYAPSGGFHLVGESEKLGNDIQSKVTNSESEWKTMNKMLRTFALCNNADLSFNDDQEKWNLVGDPTEGALLTFARKAKIVRDEELDRFPELHENPFSSARKMMSTVHQTPENEKVAFVKGAPEEVLKYSTHIYENGEVKELHDDTRQEILHKIKKMTGKALRVLAAAYKPVKSENFEIEQVERELVFIGLAGMIDPPREGVEESLNLCRKAGIEVKMVTGDHLATATAIAKEIGLLGKEENGKAMTGQEVEDLTEEELKEAVKSVKVFARVSPKHKVRIAAALKKNGEIVAMTGDGVNDAPSVKKADIGISMGIKGTEVTREASDMVLADDDFSTIVTAVEEGRGIYGNIRSFLRYLIESNFDEILLIGVTAFLAYDILPLLPIQILWLNLATDGLPATALAFDTYDEGLMERGPREPKEGLLHNMLLFVTVGAVLQFTASFTLFHISLTVWNLSDSIVRTMVFTEAVFFELFSVWNCRSETHSLWALGKKNFDNSLLVVGVGVNIIFQLLIIFFPPLHSILDTTTLTLSQLLIAVGFASPGLFILPEILIRRENETENETIKES